MLCPSDVLMLCPKVPNALPSDVVLAEKKRSLERSFQAGPAGPGRPWITHGKKHKTADNVLRCADGTEEGRNREKGDSPSVVF